mgnify:CR=1 FL=1
MSQGIYVSKDLPQFADLRKELSRLSVDLSIENNDILMPDFVLCEMNRISQRDLISLALYRRKYPYSPIIVLGPILDEDETISIFDQGIDQYIRLPCSPREIAYRIKAVLRRTIGIHLRLFQDEELWKKNDNDLIKVDLENRSFICCGSYVDASLNELKIMHLLLNDCATREGIAKVVWDSEVKQSYRNIDFLIHRLRKRIKETCDGKVSIKTIKNVGYKLNVEEEYARNDLASLS